MNISPQFHHLCGSVVCGGLQFLINSKGRNSSKTGLLDSGVRVSVRESMNATVVNNVLLK